MPLTLTKGSAQHRGMQLLGLAVTVVLVLWPVLRWQKSDVNRLTDALIIAIAVVGLNLLIGFTGQISIGHSAFFGLGAYTSAILVDTYEWTPGWTIPAAVVLCFVVGVGVGLPALRLKGLYLALVTLALAVAFPAVLTKFDSITGGPSGIRGIRYMPPDWTGLKGRSDSHLWFYWLSVLFLVIALLVVRNLIKSRIGRAMVALRDNEAAAQIMGVNLALTKTITFGISSAIAGLAGTLFAFKLGLVGPSTFGLLLSINLLVAMVVGGPASLAGPVLGGLLFIYGKDIASDYGQTHEINGLGDIVFALLLIAFVFVAPGGLTGLVRKAWARVVHVVPALPSGHVGGGNAEGADGSRFEASNPGSSGDDPPNTLEPSSGGRPDQP